MITGSIDLGPHADVGIGRYPPAQANQPIIHCAVSALDSDGNELGGVRLPDLDAPVGTHAGWNTRNAGIAAAEQIVPMTGSTTYFAPTPADRCADDRRLAISERYESAAEYAALAKALAEGTFSGEYICHTSTFCPVLAPFCDTRIRRSRNGPEEVASGGGCGWCGGELCCEV